MRRSDFKYVLDEQLIAQQPLPERTASRLLLLDGQSGRTEDLQFTDFPGLMKAGDLLVFNDTRVIPARLYGHKTSGGHVEILVERILDEHQALVHLRTSKPLKAGGVIVLDRGYRCRVEERLEDLFRVRFESATATIPDILSEVGHIPLPPYITRDDEQMDRQRYQTVFARHPGAIAAPTAGLHFDESLLARLDLLGINRVFLTLHVGSGTFQPLRVDDLEAHQMHAEYCEVSHATVQAISAAKNRGGRIVAVGTTAMRALETAALGGELQPFRGETRLFIKPGFRFACVDALLTNFHLPESTLLALVCAFAGYEKVMAAYRHAVAKQYRFFSYGDAMFVTRGEA